MQGHGLKAYGKRCVAAGLFPLALIFAFGAVGQIVITPGGGGGGTGTVTTTGAPANGQCALLSGATSVTGDAGCVYTGTGSTLTLSPSKLGTAHIVGPASATHTSIAGGGFTNQPGNAKIDLMSSDAGDTAVQVTLIGSLAGADTAENITLNGGTQVVSVNNYDVLMAAVVSSGTALGTITIYINSAPVDVVTTIVPPAVSSGLETFAAVLGNSRPLFVVASGASTKTVGIGGFNTAGASQRTPVVLTGTVPVATSTSWSSAVQVYVGDLEVGQTITVSSIGGTDTTEAVLLPVGSAAAPSLGLSAHPGTGFHFGATYAAFGRGTGLVDSALGHGLALPSDALLTWSSSATDALAATDSSIKRTAAKTWAFGVSGDATGTVNAGVYQVGGTPLAASHLSNGVTGTGAVVLQTSPVITAPTISARASAAGVALSSTATAPAATTGASQAGVGVSVTASPGVASTDTAGAAAGGGITATTGDAARNASGNAGGGDYNVRTGAGIGTGAAGLPTFATAAGNSVNVEAKGIVAVDDAGATFSATGFGSVLLNGDTARIVMASNGCVAWTATSGRGGARGTQDTFACRGAAAATFQFGGANSATPVAQTFTFQGSRGGTDTNVAGVNATFIGSLGTGTAASGTIAFKAGTPQASGTTQHVANVVMTLKDIGAAGTAKPIVNITSPPIYANNAAAVAGGLVAGDLYRTNADPDPVCVVH